MLQRLTSLPSELFLRVLLDILPSMRERWMERERPLPAELAGLRSGIVWF